MAGTSPAMTDSQRHRRWVQWRRDRTLAGPATWRKELRQPALAPPVVLALAERLAPPFRHAEVEFLHVLVLAQGLGIAVEHHAAAFQHIAVARVFQRHAGVLLRKKKGNPLLRVEVADDLENLLHELRREPHRGFVEENHLRARHQRASDRAHLLLTAGDVAGGCTAALLEPREIGVDEVEVAPDGGAGAAAPVAAMRSAAAPAPRGGGWAAPSTLRSEPTGISWSRDTRA